MHCESKTDSLADFLKTSEKCIILKARICKQSAQWNTEFHVTEFCVTDLRVTELRVTEFRIPWNSVSKKFRIYGI